MYRHVAKMFMVSFFSYSHRSKGGTASASNRNQSPMFQMFPRY